jgi:hypothetical protein
VNGLTDLPHQMLSDALTYAFEAHGNYQTSIHTDDDKTEESREKKEECSEQIWHTECMD